MHSVGLTAEIPDQVSRHPLFFWKSSASLRANRH